MENNFEEVGRQTLLLTKAHIKVVKILITMGDCSLALVLAPTLKGLALSDFLLRAPLLKG
ncbi:hypothetical protein [Desulfosporosinus hippei]|uniref:hypothetical protein n=1 Tax=Desulfosporosinus hippei TaxID=569859 RepID=UPI0015A12DD1|nr:hypothetical protein [Desulfosporosinus hippei]